MLETKCIDDNHKMLVTVLAILITNIHYLFTLASGINIPKMSPTSKFCHQHPEVDLRSYLTQFFRKRNFVQFNNWCHDYVWLILGFTSSRKIDWSSNTSKMLWCATVAYVAGRIRLGHIKLHSISFTYFDYICC